MTTSYKTWAAAIFLLLLAAAIGISGLNRDAFGWDEVSSMNAVGGTTPGLSLSETWANVTESAPDQAVGWSLMLSLWGRLVGWSEFASRALACFGGLLALTWVYRLGRDLFSPPVGLIALLLMATSVYFGVFMHQLRVFTFVALAVSMALWCYWRVMLHPRASGWPVQFGLLLAFVGLFYTHYFATLFLVALGLYHLLFAPKTRRWWGPVIVGLLAGLLFLPELRVFLAGIAVNSDNQQLQQMAIGPLAVVYYLLLSFGNGSLLTVVVVAIGMVLGLRHSLIPRPLLPQGEGEQPVRRSMKAPLHEGEGFSVRVSILIPFLTLTTLLLIIIANQILQVMTPARLRYLMPLWPLMALLVGWGLWQFRRLSRPALGIIVLGWAALGLWTSAASDFVNVIEPPELPWREMRSTLQSQGSPASDVFLFHGVPSRIREFYVAATIPMHREIIESWDTNDSLREKIGDSLRIWIGTDWRWYEEFPIDWANEPEFALISQIAAEDFVDCGRYIDHPQMRLDLFARDSIFCLDSEPLLRFGESITLQGISPLTQDGSDLTATMAWRIGPDIPPEIYSVAVHIYDTATDRFVIAADYGLPAGPVGLARIRLASDTLEPGSYEIRVGIYDWRSGERLPGLALDSGMTGDLMTVGGFTRP